LGHWPSKSVKDGSSVPQSTQRATVRLGSIPGARDPEGFSDFPFPSLADSLYPCWRYFLSAMPIAPSFQLQSTPKRRFVSPSMSRSFEASRGLR
jgi:hypothetical protein